MKDRCVDDCPICGGCGSVCTTKFDVALGEYVEIMCPVKSGEMTLDEARQSTLIEWPDGVTMSDLEKVSYAAMRAREGFVGGYSNDAHDAVADAFERFADELKKLMEEKSDG